MSHSTRWYRALICIACLTALPGRAFSKESPTSSSANACQALLSAEDREAKLAELGKKAAGGDHAAELAVAILRLQGNPSAEDQAIGVDMLRRAGEAGVPSAAGFLGTLYQEGGAGLPPDPANAFKWIRKAAEAGDPPYQQILGYYYESALAGPQNLAEAARWYRKAAAQGNARGQTNLATLYEDGRGVAQDLDEAVRFYRLAAAQGADIAMGALGSIYLTGPARYRNPAEGRRLLKIAAETDGAAQHNLGLDYVDRQDFETAMTYFDRAAENGVFRSQYQLSLGYENGWGLRRDLSRAYEWAYLAAFANEGPPIQRRDELAERLPPATVRKGKAMAEEWLRNRENRQQEANVIPPGADLCAGGPEGSRKRAPQETGMVGAPPDLYRRQPPESRPAASSDADVSPAPQPAALPSVSKPSPTSGSVAAPERTAVRKPELSPSTRKPDAHCQELEEMWRTRVRMPEDDIRHALKEMGCGSR